MMKKLLKAGIAGAIACTALVGTITPVSASSVPTTLQDGIKDAAIEITPRFMYTFEETITSWEFDTVVKYDAIESTSTSSGWRIVGLQDVIIYPKGRLIITLGYNYEYYDNYQGIQIDMDYTYNYAGFVFSDSKTIKVHV